MIHTTTNNIKKRCQISDKTECAILAPLTGHFTSKVLRNMQEGNIILQKCHRSHIFPVSLDWFFRTEFLFNITCASRKNARHFHFADCFHELLKFPSYLHSCEKVSVWFKSAVPRSNGSAALCWPCGLECLRTINSITLSVHHSSKCVSKWACGT